MREVKRVFDTLEEMHEYRNKMMAYYGDRYRDGYCIPYDNKIYFTFLVIS